MRGVEAQVMQHTTSVVEHATNLASRETASVCNAVLSQCGLWSVDVDDASYPTIAEFSAWVDTTASVHAGVCFDSTLESVVATASSTPVPGNPLDSFMAPGKVQSLGAGAETVSSIVRRHDFCSPVAARLLTSSVLLTRLYLRTVRASDALIRELLAHDEMQTAASFAVPMSHDLQQYHGDAVREFINALRKEAASLGVLCVRAGSVNASACPSVSSTTAAEDAAGCDDAASAGAAVGCMLLSRVCAGLADAPSSALLPLSDGTASRCGQGVDTVVWTRWC
jgi:hypothetical protein